MADPGKRLESYTDDPYYFFNPDRGDMRQADRNASLGDITRYIYQSLIDFQGKWELSNINSNAIRFPNARYLNQGDTIINKTLGEFYRIIEILDKRRNVVRISAKNMPNTNDVLELTNDNMVNFVSDYSQEYKQKARNEWVDTITFTVNRKEPGTIGKHPFDPPSEIKPRVREYRIDEENPDSHIRISGQWFDNLIQFDCWSKTNNRADSLIEWFEDFMFKYTWVWKKNGVNEMLYWMRKQDEFVKKWRNDLAVRSLLYYFKTEKIIVIREHDFKQIDIYLELNNATPSGFYGVGYNEIPPSGKTEILDGGLTVKA